MYHSQTCHLRPCRMKNEACDLDGNLTYRCGLPKGSLVRVCVSMSARGCTNTVVLERHHREMPGLAYHSSHHDTGSWCQLCISAVRSASLQSSLCPQLPLLPSQPPHARLRLCLWRTSPATAMTSLGPFWSRWPRHIHDPGPGPDRRSRRPPTPPAHKHTSTQSQQPGHPSAYDVAPSSACMYACTYRPRTAARSWKPWRGSTGALAGRVSALQESPEPLGLDAPGRASQPLANGGAL